MDNKALVAVGVVAILVIAGVAVFMLADQKEDEDPVILEGDALLVKGNANNDWYVNDEDAKTIQWLIDQGKTVEEYPLADANNDGKLDAADIEVVNKIVNRETVEIFHINFHDQDANGTMDKVWAETQFPISSCIINASNNVAMNMLALGLVEQVKGASYSSSLDKALYGDNYLDTEKCVKVGKSSTTIPFEDGKGDAASQLIKDENVTAIISDWNRSYLKNQADFEKSDVDVVRLASGATDDACMIHTNMLLGLLFGCEERATDYLNLLLEIVHYVDDKVEGVKKPLVVASSWTGDMSSGESDYTKCLLRAGGEFALKDIDFQQSASVKLKDHPEIKQKQIDYVVHMRSSIDYSQTSEELKADYEKYTAPMADLQNSDKIQYMISGTVPMSLRIALAANAIHDGIVSMDWINEKHQLLVDNFFDGKDFDVSKMTFIITPESAKLL